MVTPEQKSEKRALLDRLRRLKHLKKTRMLSLDDGGFVRDVVAQMDHEIKRLEKVLEETDAPSDSD